MSWGQASVGRAKFALVLALAPLLGSPANPELSSSVGAPGAQAHGPDLGLTMLRSGSDPRGVIVAGATVTVSMGVNNQRGDADAHSAILTVTLPDRLKLQQARPAPNKTEPANAGASSLTWNLGTVAAGAFPRIFELDLTVAGDARPDTELHISATVKTSDNDANQKNNSAVYALRVVPAVADLAVQSDLGAKVFTIGAPIEFTAEVANWGSVPASGSTLTLALPPKVSVQASDPPPTRTKTNTVTWQLGDIEPTESRTVAITIALDTGLAATVGDTTTESLLKFNFDASTATIGGNPANNHLEVDQHVVQAGFDLNVWVNVKAELLVGEDVIYMITFGNYGNGLAPKASVSLNLPEGLSLVSADPPPARSSNSDKFRGGVLEWDAGDLPVGETRRIKCTVHVISVPERGSLVMATASAVGTDIDPSNNVAYARRYAQRGARGSHPLAAPGPPRRPLFLWIVIIAVVVGILVLVLRRTRHRS